MARDASGSSPRAEWLSVHLYLEVSPDGVYGDAADAVLLDVVAPFVSHCRQEGWIDRYFFVRYVDHGTTGHGAHIRLRLHGEKKRLRNSVWPYLRLRALWARQTSTRQRRRGDSQSTAIVHAKAIPYVPETERYGGVAALSTAEELFCESSDAALLLLPPVRQKTRSVRLGSAALAMLALVHSVADDRSAAREFFEEYSQWYGQMIYGARPELKVQIERQFSHSLERQEGRVVQYIGEAWRRLCCGESISDPIDQLKRAAVKNAQSIHRITMVNAMLAADVAEVVGPIRVMRLMSSQVHMMNNRMGIRPDEEAFLAKACAVGLLAVDSD
ncbi:MAG: thiopeptide-type bacteriocin biosynthesis protein [Pseudomonadota bacterium]|jgi:thiopeptide-type bacteriocin biosynthesis protein